MAEFRELSKEAAGQVDALVKRISVGRELDGEMQAELRGHVEDKVRGYLSGEVRPSEADAVLLATKHFGEAGVIQEMFEGVHGAEHAGSMMKRFCVVALVYLFVTSVWGYALTMAWNCYLQPAIQEAAYGDEQGRLTAMVLAQDLVFELVEPAVVLLAIFLALRWLKRSARGMRVTAAMDWGRIVMGFVLYAALLSFENSPFMMSHFARERVMPWHVNIPYQNWNLVELMVRSGVYAMIGAMMWVWWCGQGARTRRGLTVSLAAWSVFELLWGPASVVVATATWVIGGYSLENGWATIQMSVPALLYYSWGFVVGIAGVVWMGCWLRGRRSGVRVLG